jgi:hypothetical protein
MTSELFIVYYVMAGVDDPGFDYVETKMSLVDPLLFYLLIGRLRNRSKMLLMNTELVHGIKFPSRHKTGHQRHSSFATPCDSPDRHTREKQGFHAGVHRCTLINSIDCLNSCGGHEQQVGIKLER